MKRIKGESCNLANLKIGQRAKIISLEINDSEIKRHLLELGMIEGTEVQIKKKAPFGEPVVVALRGYELFLGYQELRKIQVGVL